MPVIEGVDYSRTANADWAGLANTLKANGNHFVGRYAVNDKSPNGRGIGASEYQAMKAAGLGVFLYWESTEGWMLDGYAAGVAAAQNAQININQAGMPPNTVVYFACDFDATPAQQTQIDDTLRGAASIIGLERVGIYGGFWVVSRCAANGTAKWFCQTSAWSGGQWFTGNHLEQYGYNRILYGTNCDDVRAKQENYGQIGYTAPPAPKPDVTPDPKPKPAPKPRPTAVPGIKLPKGLTVAMLQRLYTGNANNEITIQGEKVSFDPKGEISRAWLRRGLDSIPEGKTWREGGFPQIKDRVRRGADGKEGTDWVFSDGSVIHNN